jgi:hypothetical protein
MTRVLHKNLALLRVGEPGVIEELRAAVNFDDHVLGWVSDTEAILDPHMLKDLLVALEARGMTALVRRVQRE